MAHEEKERKKVARVARMNGECKRESDAEHCGKGESLVDSLHKIFRPTKAAGISSEML